jgi:predicted O-methyltransferase YrrM
MTESVASRPPLLLTLPILERMRRVEGWLFDEEADLLLAAVVRAVAEIPQPATVVEVGSYCGRSTVVLGSALQALAPTVRLHAIDPHEGEIGAPDSGVSRTEPTLAKFTHTIAEAGLTDVVELVQQRSYETDWKRPIAFLLVDGLHDYANVSRDFHHFEPWLVPGAYVAFHDYSDYWPNVKAFVNELLSGRRYERIALAASMILVRQRADDALR